MFEQSIVATQPANKTWTLGVSMLAQIGLVSAAILFPLVYSDILPAFSMLGQSIVAPLPPAAPRQVTERRGSVAQSTATESTVFKPPSSVTKLDFSREDPLIEAGDDGVAGSPFPIGANPLDRILSHAHVPPTPAPVRETVKPEVKAHAPVPVSSTIQEAKLLRKIIPIYPPMAITTRVQGTVHLVGVISRDGTIRELKTIDGSPLLIRTALDAVRQWIYRPTVLNGETVEVVAPITVTFVLNR